VAVVEVKIFPVGTSSASLSRFVAGCVAVLRKEEGVKYQLTPMGTIIEGELDSIMAIIRRMHEAPFQAGVDRVVTDIRIDDRRDKPLTMAGKLAAVESKLV